MSKSGSRGFVTRSPNGTTALHGEDILVTFTGDDAIDDLGDVKGESLVCFTELADLFLELFNTVRDDS